MTASARSPRLGVLTIGQSPRSDLVPDIVPLLPGVEIVEAGVLDDLGHDDLEEMRPRGVDRLTTRLRDGSSVVLDEHDVVERVPGALARLEADVDAVLLACTGHFPSMPHARPLLVPDRLLAHAVAALAPAGRPVGVVSPLPEQEAGSVVKLAARLDEDVPVLTDAASPYTDDLDVLAGAGRRLARRGAAIVALDCIGYDETMRSVVAEAAGVPVVLGRSVAARMAAELLVGTGTTTTTVA